MRRVTFKGRPGVGPGSERQLTMWRCGILHTAAGADWAEDAFTEAEWQRLEEDPLFDVGEPGDGPVRDGAVPEDAAELVERSARKLMELADVDALRGKSGAFKLPALRAALGGDPNAITDEVRDAIGVRFDCLVEEELAATEADLSGNPTVAAIRAAFAGMDLTGTTEAPDIEELRPLVGPHADDLTDELIATAWAQHNPAQD